LKSTNPEFRQDNDFIKFEEGRVIETGREAPDFCLTADNDETVCIKDFKGMWVLLYFYSKDNTSG
jgi:peroxiredoxin